MQRMLTLGLLGVVVVVSATTLASAQFAPVAPAPLEGTLPPPQVVPAPPPAVLPPPVAIPVRPLTIAEFASSFKPLPGAYEVLLIHPKTGCPVKVCFTLPPGCIRNVRVTKHKIEFVYKHQRDVVIRFLFNGKVWVHG